MAELPQILHESFELVRALPGDKPLKCFHVKGRRNGQAEYVLRVLPGDLAPNRELVWQFHQFFQNYQQIGRPGLPRCHSVEIRGDTVYALEEFVEGRTLSQYVQESLPEFATDIIDQVCDALHYAHLHNVFHLCITPSDIIISADRVVLVGFGTAVFLKGTYLENIPESCRRFIAPEALSKFELSAASDIFSLACTIKECWPRLASNPILTKALQPSDKDRFLTARAFQAKLGELSPKGSLEVESRSRVPVLKLTIKTRPEGAQVKVDGKSLGTTTGAGLLVPWKPGSAILIEKEAYEPQELLWHTPPLEPETFVVLEPSESSGVRLTATSRESGARDAISGTEVSRGPTARKSSRITPLRLVLLAAFIIVAIGLGRLAWFLVSPPEPSSTTRSVKSRDAPDAGDLGRTDLSRTPQETKQDSPAIDRPRSTAARWERLLTDGQDLYRKARYAEAETLLKGALETSEHAFGPRDINTALSCDALGLVYLEKANYDNAEALFRRSHATKEELLGPSHQDVARSLRNVGMALKGKGAYTEAESCFTKALTIREQASKRSPPELSQSLADLGFIYIFQRKYPEAERSFRKAIELSKSSPSQDQSELARSLGGLGQVLRLRRKYFEAEPLLKRALALRESQMGPNHPETASSLSALGSLYIAWGNYAEAEVLLKRALSIREKALGPDHPDVGVLLSTIADLKKGRGDPVEAESYYQKAVMILEKSLGPDHPTLAIRMSALANLYYSQQRYAEAKLLWEKSLAIMERVFGPEHQDVRTLQKNLKHLAQQQNR
ncbi:MAG: tetratricopeptide repeat-containing protein kinase family protein [Thermodesulfobacteriota bacterium]